LAGRDGLTDRAGAHAGSILDGLPRSHVPSESTGRDRTNPHRRRQSTQDLVA
jgi:hypothetical protein